VVSESFVQKYLSGSWISTPKLLFFPSTSMSPKYLLCPGAVFLGWGVLRVLAVLAQLIHLSLQMRCLLF
jgi:hypothetical protein